MPARTLQAWSAAIAVACTAACGNPCDDTQFPTAEGATLYVADCGNDENPGTVDEPLCTLAAAAKKAGAKTTILVAAETFSESIDFKGGVSLKGMGSGKTLVTPPGGNPGILVAGAGSTSIQGLTISKAAGMGIGSTGATLALHDVEITATSVLVAKGAAGAELVRGGHGLVAADAPSLTLSSCRLADNGGVGMVVQGVAQVSVTDPAHLGAATTADNGKTGVSPTFKPNSRITGNGLGGVAILGSNLAAAKAGVDPKVDITATDIADNFDFAVLLQDSSARFSRAALRGTKKRPKVGVADGLMIIEGQADAPRPLVELGPGTVVADNESVGAIVNGSAQLVSRAEVSSNEFGGIWALGKQAAVLLGPGARLASNQVVGAAALGGAWLDVAGDPGDKAPATRKVRVEATQEKAIVIDAQLTTVKSADGIGVFDGAQARIRGALLLNNKRAAIIAEGVRLNAADAYELDVAESKLAGNKYGFVLRDDLSTAAKDAFAKDNDSDIAKPVVGLAAGVSPVKLNWDTSVKPFVEAPELLTRCQSDKDCPTMLDGCYERKCIATKDASAWGLCVHVKFPCTCLPGFHETCPDEGDCKKGTCKAAGKCEFILSDAACNDQNPCTLDKCEANKCVNQPDEGKPCDDGNHCTEEDVCKAGACTFKTYFTCVDDGDACTWEHCLPGYPGKCLKMLEDKPGCPKGGGVG